MAFIPDLKSAGVEFAVLLSSNLIQGYPEDDFPSQNPKAGTHGLS